MSEEDEVNMEALFAAELAGFTPAARGGSSAPLGAHVVSWRELRDEEAAREWKLLRAFVEWVTVRYQLPISTVPTCWYRHPALVEELSALHTAHLAAFDTTDAGFGPISWHERFAAALPRLTRAYGGGCNNGHQPAKPRSWDGITDEQEWDTWITQTHAHRGTPPHTKGDTQ